MPYEFAVRLLEAYELGASQMSTFVEERLNTYQLKLWEPLPHLKLPTFVTVMAKQKKVKSGNDKIITVTVDSLLGHLLVAANARDIHLKVVLSYEPLLSHSH